MIRIFTNRILLVLGFMLCMNNLFSQSAFNDKENIKSYELKSKKEREAYENKVKYKLEDFYNYLQIIGNPEVEKYLREHTLGLTQKMFSKDVKVIDFMADSNSTILLSSFLKKLVQSNETIKFSISNVATQSESDQQSTSYTLQIKKQNKVIDYQLTQLFTISLVDKKFGSKTKQVTLITLGEIH